MIESYDGVAPFKVAELWSSLPESDSYSEVSDVAVDGADRVYLLTRGLPRVIVYDRAGEFLTAWGGDVLSPRPHGLSIAGDGSLYVVDEGAHQIVHFDSDGRILASDWNGTCVGHGPRFPASRPWRTSSIPSRPAPVHSTFLPLSSRVRAATSTPPTATATLVFTDLREIRDAYCSPGESRGLAKASSACLMASSSLLAGELSSQTARMTGYKYSISTAPSWLSGGTCSDPRRSLSISDGNLLVAEIAWFSGERSFRKGRVEKTLPARLSLLDGETGAVLGRWSEVNDGSGPGGLLSPHGIALDSAGNLYVGEVNASFGLREERRSYRPEQISKVQAGLSPRAALAQTRQRARIPL